MSPNGNTSFSSKRSLVLLCIAGIFSLAGCGGSGESAAPPSAANTPPTADAGADQTVDARDTVTLSGTDSDSDGTIASRQWTQVEGTTVELSSGSSASATFRAPSVTEETDLVFEYSVTDDDGDEASDRTTVTVVPKDRALTNDSFIEPGGVETIMLDGAEIEAAADQVLVYLAEDVTQEQVNDLLDRVEEISSQFAFNFELRTVQLTLDTSSTISAVMDEMSEFEGVSGAGPNMLLETNASPKMDNREGYLQWRQSSGADAKPFEVPAPVDASFAGDYWIDAIGARPGWKALSKEALQPSAIAVVDSGLPASQSALDESRIARFNSMGDSISNDDTESITDHGLWVAAFASGYGNSPSRRGVDPHSSLTTVDIAEPRTKCPVGDEVCYFLTDVHAGIRVAINQRAKVVNVSITPASQCSDRESDRLSRGRAFRHAQKNAMHFARRRDALVVWAAGNDCTKSDDLLLPDKDSESESDSWLSHGLIVAATTSANRDACFSRMGAVVNLAAPGEGIGWGLDKVGSGTSYAAPLVAGAGGLLRAINSTFSAPEVRSLLLNSASRAIVPATEATNRNAIRCAEDSVVESEDWEGTQPTRLLNLNSAVQSALIAKDIDLTREQDLVLALDERAQITIDVDVPSSGINALDIVFLIDQSGSYSDDIDTLQSQAQRIIDGLNERDIDVQFSVAGFADFPIGGFGGSGDVAYRLHQPLTSDTESVISAIERLDDPLMKGGDSPESQLEALYQVATGRGRDINGDGDFDDAGELQPSSIGWREGALPVVIFATDAAFHDGDEPNYPGATKAQAIAALNDEGIIVFGLQSGDRSAASRAIMEITDATQGVTFGLDAASSQIVQRVADALDEALSSLSVSLTTIAGNEWVESVVPEVQTVTQGGSASFVVNLIGRRRESVEDLSYDVYLWAYINETALIKRIAIPISVPAAKRSF